MNIHCCSFASKSFTHNQNIQKKYFLKAGFPDENIHLFDPSKLSKEFYTLQPSASEFNRFGWFAFKPYMLISILKELKNDDILFYLDTNDKPLYGLVNYLNEVFSKNKNIDLLAPLTNYPNLKYLSSFNRKNLSIELLISSLFKCQPEAGALAVRNSPKSRAILWSWYNLTFVQAYELDKSFPFYSRHDQESLYILSRIYKSIKLESWFRYKLTGRGLRKFIEFESLRFKQN